ASAHVRAGVSSARGVAPSGTPPGVLVWLSAQKRRASGRSANGDPSGDALLALGREAARQRAICQWGPLRGCFSGSRPRSGAPAGDLPMGTPPGMHFWLSAEKRRASGRSANGDPSGDALLALGREAARQRAICQWGPLRGCSSGSRPRSGAPAGDLPMGTPPGMLFWLSAAKRRARGRSATGDPSGVPFWVSGRESLARGALAAGEPSG